MTATVRLPFACAIPAMPVVGTNVTIDVHSTEEVDIGSIRGAIRRRDRVDPALAESVRDVVRGTASRIFQSQGIDDVDVDLRIELVDQRVPGAPRERIVTRLDVEGSEDAVASVDDGLSPPARARIADAVEEEVLDYLFEYDIGAQSHVIVRVTPVQFR